MTKKTRLSFSSIMADEKKENKTDTNPDVGRLENRRGTSGPSSLNQKKKTLKSSTYQYTKKRFGGNSGSRPFGAKSQFKNNNSEKNAKIPPPEK